MYLFIDIKYLYDCLVDKWNNIYIQVYNTKFIMQYNMSRGSSYIFQVCEFIIIIILNIISVK